MTILFRQRAVRRAQRARREARAGIAPRPKMSAWGRLRLLLRFGGANPMASGQHGAAGDRAPRAERLATGCYAVALGGVGLGMVGTASSSDGVQATAALLFMGALSAGAVCTLVAERRSVGVR